MWLFNFLELNISNISITCMPWKIHGLSPIKNTKLFQVGLNSTHHCTTHSATKFS